MRPDTLLEVLDAGILSRYVQSDFKQRGGIIVAGPPGVLKSTFVKQAALPHPDARILSDLTQPSFKKMRDDFTSGKFSTISLLEMDKIYMRQQTTFINMEGVFMQLVETGFHHFATEDQSTPSIEARAHIQGAITFSLMRKNWERWKEIGFARRFLWITISRIADPDRLRRAIREWELIDTGTIASKRPANGVIKYNLTLEDSFFIERIVREQQGSDTTAFTLLKKIFQVLRWKYPIGKNGSADKAVEIMKDLKQSLTLNGDELIL